VPARNTIFLSFALAGPKPRAFDIYIGVNASTTRLPGLPPGVHHRLRNAGHLATKAAFGGAGRYRIHTPLIDLSKAEIIRRGLALGVDLPVDPLVLRSDPGRAGLRSLRLLSAAAEGVAEAGESDPVEYV